MQNQLERYRELLAIRDTIPHDIDVSLDRFSIIKAVIAHYSLADNLNWRQIDRKQWAQEIAKTKELLIDELRYLNFQQTMLEEELERLYVRFTGK